MSILSDWANKSKRMWDERLRPGGDTQRLFDEGGTYLTKTYAAKEKHIRSNTQASNFIESQLPDPNSLIETHLKSDDSVNEPDTRATLANRANRADEYSTANRRGVSKTRVNKTKGKKHSLLTQRKGGR